MKAKILNFAAIGSLVLTLLGLSFVFYQDLIFEMPHYQHFWTQADKYAQVLINIREQPSFWEPSSYILQKNEASITAVDFPLHEFLLGYLMRFFGTEAPSFLRFYALLMSFCGYIGLFALVRLFSKSIWPAIFTVLLSFLLPITTYYQVCFLPSTTAWASFWVGLYFFIAYRTFGGHFRLIAAFLLLGLSAAVRTPYHIFLLCAVLMLVWESWQKKELKKKEIYSILLTYGILFGWLLYKNWLQNYYGTIYLSHLTPVGSWAEFVEFCPKILSKWHNHFCSNAHYLLFLPCLFSVFLYALKKGTSTAIKTSASLTFLAFCAAFAYFLAMFYQFFDHEYYFMDSFYPPVILTFGLGFSYFFEQNENSFFKISLLCIASTFAITHSQKKLKEYTNPSVYTRPALEIEDFTNSAAFLDSLNIAPQARIMAVAVVAPNFPLLMLKRKGYSCLDTHPNQMKEFIESHTFDYVVVQNRYLFSEMLAAWPDFYHHLKKTGDNGRISIFTYQLDKNYQDMATFLGTTPVFNLKTAWQTAIKFNEKQEFGAGMETRINQQKIKKIFYGLSIQKTEATDDFINLVFVCKNQKSGKQNWYAQNTQNIFGSEKSWIWLDFMVPDSVEMEQCACYLWNTNKVDFVVDSSQLIGH